MSRVRRTHDPEYQVPHSALHEYQTRLTARRATRDALDAADARYANGRLATVGFAVLIGILAWNSVLSFWWLTVLVVVFAWLMRRHDRVLRARDGAARAMALYERGLARLEDRWVGTGEAGDRFRDDRHVYANDLDLFGHGSLFQLLSVARTRTGEETLARWLTAPADAPEIRARQDAVAELAPALDLRERLAMAGADVRTSVQTDRLLEWAEMPMQPAQALNAFTWLFTAATLGGITFLAITSTWLPLGIVLLLQAVVFHRLKDQINAIVSARDPESTADFVADALTHRAHDLDVVADLLKTLEREPITCPRLTALRDKLNVEGVGASRIIRQLHRLAVLHDSERNTIIFPLALFLIGKLEAALILGSLLQLVRPHVALAVDRWRKRHGTQVRAWLETVAELEALMSLASFKFRTRQRSVSRDHPRRRSAPARPRCWTACSWAIRCCPRRPWSGMTCTLPAPRSCSWSAARTCLARARCCGPSASTPCSRSPAPRSAPRHYD